jgi:hypothetical protein
MKPPTRLLPILALDRSDPGGLWKAVVPPSAMHGEFSNEDPVGLAGGKHTSARRASSTISIGRGCINQSAARRA